MSVRFVACVCLLLAVHVHAETIIGALPIAQVLQLDRCGQFAVRADCVTFTNTSTYSTVDVREADVLLASPANSTFGQLARVGSGIPLPANDTCKTQLDALPSAYPCDYYIHYVSDADTHFAFASGASGNGIGYWSHPDGNLSQPMQMTLTPGVYCPNATVMGKSHFWIRDIAGRAGNLLLDAQGDGNAQFIFQSDVIVHFEGTNVTLLNSAKADKVLWYANHTVTVGMGDSPMQTNAAGTYMTRPGGAVRMRQTNLDGQIFGASCVEFEGSGSITVPHLMMPGENPGTPFPPGESSSSSTGESSSSSSSSTGDSSSAGQSSSSTGASSTGQASSSTGASSTGHSSSSTGASSSTGQNSTGLEPPLADAGSSDTPFIESPAGIAIVVTSGVVVVAGAAAAVWVNTSVAAKTAETVAESAQLQKTKTNTPKKHKGKHHNKDKKRLISNTVPSDQAAVSDLIRMPKLQASRSRLVGISIE